MGFAAVTYNPKVCLTFDNEDLYLIHAVYPTQLSKCLCSMSSSPRTLVDGAASVSDTAEEKTNKDSHMLTREASAQSDTR
jgi:hypothetical protein